MFFQEGVTTVVSESREKLYVDRSTYVDKYLPIGVCFVSSSRFAPNSNLRRLPRGTVEMYSSETFKYTRAHAPPPESTKRNWECV